MRRVLAWAIALVLIVGARAQASVVPVPPQTTAAAWTDADVAALHHDLDALFAADPLPLHAHVGLLALDTLTGAPLYARDADDAFQPASTLKLLVASTALATLGPAYRERTTLSWRAPLLTLRVGGDAQLRADDLASAAEAAAAAGVRDVWGIAIDRSRYDRVHAGAGWSWDDFPYAYAAPVSAAALDDNALHLTIAPGARIGDPVSVSGLPPGANVHVRIEARTAASTSDSTLDLTRDGATIVVIGTQPLGEAPEVLDAAVPDAAEYLRSMLSAALVRAHVRVRPPALLIALGGAAVAEPPLWTHDSPPLSDTVATMLLPSDNLMAEVLLKELAAANGTLPGTSAAGIALETHWLQSIGGDPSATAAVVDGSGLSPYDRIAPRTLATILQADWNAPYRDVLLDALPVAGVRGTLAESFIGTPAEGRVFAKTGSLSHVRTLAGFVQPRCRRAVTFVLDIDDWVGDAAALSAFRANVVNRIIESGC